MRIAARRWRSRRGRIPEDVDVTVCSFDQPELHTPGDHTWVEDQLPWIQLDDDLPAYTQKRKPHG